MLDPEKWSVPCDWPGETVFIVGGGPSVLAFDPEILRGRRIVVINSSYRRFPFADYLIFADDKWWTQHAGETRNFAGRIVGVMASGKAERFLRVKRKDPPGLSLDRTRLTFRRTTLVSAINMAALQIVPCSENARPRIVLLGADGKRSETLRDEKGQPLSHHHEKHRWPVKPGCWDEHAKDLATIVESLKALGIECINATPNSAHRMFPFVPLEEILNARSPEADRQLAVA